ncbi:phage major tail tube protein [Xenorhabdus sp. DI]|uniref:phage major tail tube protein n=1 Tax=Xenorhabdus doucetiae TaxID=351671 RepID=UPI0019BC151E|nr:MULTISPECIES: phage major tail tube protein [unclassified Xenorhabdus]MBD2783686.1 phage major tail tube protein [Xenorhabdus sp. 3]MBD2789863.1 phage major tail tube protein [Xenorhabdus sp. DI]
MGMPKKLFMFDVYIDGQTYLGQVEEVTTPKLTLKTEDYQGAGMPGSVAVLMGMDGGALDMEVTMGGLEANLLKTWGGRIDSLQLRFAGSYYDDATGEAVACEIQTRGRFTEVDWGSAKAGENTQHKYTLKNTYCKITLNGDELHEVDMLNLVWKVGGKDLLEKHRTNIGH